MSWTTVLVLSTGSYLLKSVGLLALADRQVPGRLLRLVELMPPAVLAALVVVQTIGGEARAVVFDARLFGMAAAAVAVWRQATFLTVVVSGVVVTAIVRAVT